MGERPALLIVEDHEESRAGLTCALEKKGFLVHQARDGKSALGIAAREDLQAAIVDLRLPDIDGLKVLNELLAHRPGLPVVVVTAYASIDTAVAAMKQGAADFLTKPLRLDDLLRVLDRSLAQRAQAGPAARPINLEMAQFGILGGSALMRDVFDRIKRIAPYYRTVLILGESGTGKELVARALHALGPGPTQPFVAVNCATLSEQLLESEIFGHERGAFTSADQAKVGMMEAANKGTIFLDEVNEMGLACQAKLLRAVERHEFRRVGGTRKIKVDLRVIGASNANLDEWVTTGRFRPDLYYRLKVLTITIPPLRERREAIPTLIESFLSEQAQAIGKPPKRLTAAAQQQLMRYAWPGNVRELKNTMESLTLMSAAQTLDVGDLPAAIRGARAGVIQIPVGTSLAEAERRIIQRTIEGHPTIKQAAHVLGIGLRTLHTKLRQYNLNRKTRSARSSE